MFLSARDLELTREKNGAVFTLAVPMLHLQTGDIVAVVGQSGCGKSTLLDILALILCPQQGQMSLQSADEHVVNLTQASASVLAQVRREKLGYVLQSGGLLPFLNVRENILLPARLLGISEKQSHDWLHTLLENLGIASQVDKKPQHLSGGQRQRVAIARALIHRPALVLADEPTAAVDSDAAQNICSIFRSVVQESGAAAIIVSHDKELMRAHADAWAEFTLSTNAQGHVRSTLQWPISHIPSTQGRMYA